MTDLRSEIDYLHSILELLAEIREGLGRIEAKLPEMPTQQQEERRQTTQYEEFIKKAAHKRVYG